MTRIEKIKKRLYEKEFYTKKEWWGEDKTILTDEEVKKEPLVVRKAMAKHLVLSEMPIEIKEDELIVGVVAMNSIGFGRTFPEYATQEEKDAAAKSCYSVKSVWGHHPPDYGMVIQHGISAVKKKIYDRIAEEEAKAEPDAEALNLFYAMLISLDGVIRLANRYSALALTEAMKQQDPKRRAELLEISRICSRVPEYPAETFQEAVQSSWFIFVALQSVINAVPVGRADQYLYPAYQKDIRLGRITKEYATEIVGSWLAKFSERVQLNKDHWELHFESIDVIDGGDPDDVTALFDMENFAEYNFGTSANHWLINMILGGMNPDGTDATNDLTYMILEQWAYLQLVAPVLSVRLHDGSPKELCEKCCEVLRNGSGEPCLYNDEVIVNGFVKAGVPLEDARCYSNDGCWETLIPGKSNFSYVHLEVMQLLEYMFTHGESLVRKRKEGKDIGDVTEIGSYQEFYDKFMIMVNDQVDRIIKNKVKYSYERYKIAPTPLLSALVEGCIESGRDMAVCGAKYNFYCIVVTGLASLADSLAVVKKLVFDEHKVTLAELRDAMMTNYEGMEPLRQMLLNKAPKFGNDDPLVDELSVKFLREMDELIQKKNASGVLKPYLINLAIGTFENYPRFGHNLGASIDGRLYQEPIGSNYSATIGLDKNGPTAMIKSATKADLVPYFVGCPIDLQINSNEVQGEDGIQRMVALVQGFRKMGGVMLTMNGVSKEELEDAMVNPMKHQGLRVRLGGLSAYFIQLAKEQQLNIIKRSGHSV